MKTFDKRLSEIEVKQDTTNTKLDTLDVSVQALQPALPTPVSETATAAVLKEYEIPATKRFVPTEIRANNFASSFVPDLNTKSLFHFNDTIVDEQGTIWEGNGGTPLFTTGKFENGLNLQSGSGSFGIKTTDLSKFLSLTDFTFEFFINRKSGADGTYLIYNSNASWLRFKFSPPYYDINCGGVALTYFTYLPFNVWAHIAVVNDATSFRLYENGIRVLEAASCVIPAPTGTMYLGVGQPAILPDCILDEVRFSNTARYTGANFTVPTAPFVGGVSYPRPTKFYLDIGRGASYDRVMEKAISGTDTSILLSTALIESGVSIDSNSSMNPVQGRTFYPGDKIKLSTDSGETDFAIKGNLF